MMALNTAAMVMAMFVPAATGELPGDDPGEAGRKFVEAANSGGDRARIDAVPEVFAASVIREKGAVRLAGLMERVAATLGPLEFHHAELARFRAGQAERMSLHVYARAVREGNWKDLQFRVDPDPPHRITELAFIADVAEPVYLPAGAITDPGVRDWLNAYIDRLAAVDDLAGALLIARGDEILVERYFGFADSARAVRCEPHTRFNLGSGSKMFTALVLGQLVAEGKLSWDSPLEAIIPSWPDTAWLRQTTVGNLVSHTAGLAEYWSGGRNEALRGLTRTADILPFVVDAGVDFAPGTAARYSNSNFIVAGAVIEAVTGRDYHEVVRERILQRAGLGETVTMVEGDRDGRLAEPLTGGRGAWRVASRGARGSSAGGGFSTARDMLRFGRGLAAGRIVPPAVLAEMTRSHTAQFPDTQLDYGYGFILESGGGVSSYGHGGIAAGVNFEFRFFPELDITLVAFSNQDNGAYDSLRKIAARLITGER